ncbi:hypothetical protein LguiA_007425 [Lonicera macranthoides]
MRYLETLDLSSNHCSGQIPPGMCSLTFLNHLNLSHNNFSGPIPSGDQFPTFNESIYEGNPGLCGSPLLTKCKVATDEKDGDHRGHNGDDREDKYEKLQLFVSIALGFIIGFWSVCGSLVIKKTWRDAYFGFFKKVRDGIIMLVEVNVNHVLEKNWKRLGKITKLKIVKTPKNVALDLVRCYPHLVTLKLVNGDSVLKAMARKSSAFPSGTSLSLWQRILYSCVPVNFENYSKTPDGFDIENPYYKAQEFTQLCHGSVQLCAGKYCTSSTNNFLDNLIVCKKIKYKKYSLHVLGLLLQDCERKIE